MLFSIPQDDYRDGTYIDAAGKTKKLTRYMVTPLGFTGTGGKEFSCGWQVSIPDVKDRTGEVKASLFSAGGITVPFDPPCVLTRIIGHSNLSMAEDTAASARFPSEPEQWRVRMEIYDKQGRLIIPISQRGKNVDSGKKTKYAVTEAYCPNGCSIIDSKHPINGYPGLRFKFSRQGMEGEFVISAIEGDFEKILLSGSLEEGKRDELFCPHCGVAFAKLVTCNCAPGADMVVVGLTPELDFNNAVTFCNVTGCHNGAFVKSGEVLRHLRLQ